MSSKGKVCLVLGGGGVRGLAHLGVLQVLERNEIPIDCMIGTSVGAVVGASYAIDPDALSITRRAVAYFESGEFAANPFKKVFLKSENVEQNFLRSLFANIKKGYAFSNLLRRPSIFPGEKLYQVIADLVPDRDFSETQIPFAVPALDLRSGTEVLLTDGPLRQAVFASCSLPGFFPPVEYRGMLLADAGVIGPVPVSPARHFHPTTIIAVDITSDLERMENVERGLDVILRVESLACSRLNSIELEGADVIIQPRVGKKYWSDFSGFEQLINEGVLAAEGKVDAIRAAVFRKKSRSFFWRSQASSH
jgi:NTE family protein